MTRASLPAGAPPRSPAVAGYRQLSVIAESRRLDLSVAGNETATSVIPQLLRMLRVHPPHTAGGLDSAPRWVLCRPGPVPVAADRPLGEVLGEGETVYLIAELHRFTPPRVTGGDGVFAEAVAAPGWTPSDSRRAGAAVSAALAVLAGVLYAVSALRGVVPPWTAAAVTAGLSGVALLLGRRAAGGARVAPALAAATVPLWIVTGWSAERHWWPELATNPSAQVSVLCAAGLLGAAVVAATANTTRARAALVGAVTALLLTLLATLIAAAGLPAIGAGAAAAAVTAAGQALLVLLAPRLAANAARLLVPAASRRTRGRSPEPVAGPASDGAQLVLTALLAGGGTALVPAWWVLGRAGLAAVPVLLVTVGLVLLQSTAYQRRHQRAIVLAVGLAGIGALAVAVLPPVGPAEAAPVLAAVAALVALGASGLIRTPLPAAHPRAIRAAEIAEKVLLALLLPALLAVLGFFSFVAQFGAWWGR